MASVIIEKIAREIRVPFKCECGKTEVKVLRVYEDGSVKWIVDVLSPTEQYEHWGNGLPTVRDVNDSVSPFPKSECEK